MSEATIRTDERSAAVAAVHDALRRASMLLPHLAGLAQLVRVAADERVATAGVFASGRFLVGPRWFLGLSLPERTFVAAHELLHLAMRSHERCTGENARLFNVAHDYVINDMLRTALGMEPPAGGLNWHGAASMSAESIVADLRRRLGQGESLPADAWSGPPLGALGEALARAGIGRAPTERPREAPIDVLDGRLERQWFPADDPRAAGRAAAQIAAAADRAAALGVWREKVSGAFTPPSEAPEDGRTALARVLDARHRPPWEMALQRWLDETAPAARSFGRASRRQGDRADVVLPGRRREGHTLNLVLDTSGSMWSVLESTLGVLKSFCDAVNVTSVRILQCGEKLEVDEIVAVDGLAAYRIQGGIGGDLKPGMWRLASDPDVEAALVITDGHEDYPPEPMPYHVLWAITGEVPSFFAPSYGQILRIWD